METQNKKQNYHSVQCSSSPRFVFYLNNFQTKAKKKGYKKKKRKKRRKPLLVDGQNKFISMLEPNGHQ
jgi:hypothetical protein